MISRDKAFKLYALQILNVAAGCNLINEYLPYIIIIIIDV